MNTKVDQAEVKAKKEKAESVQADKELKQAKAEANKKHIALKNLATSQGQVKKGEEFTCNSKELAIFKKVKAV
jgi:hypothetical protein